MITRSRRLGLADPPPGFAQDRCIEATREPAVGRRDDQEVDLVPPGAAHQWRRAGYSCHAL